jgi:dolichol-phosphate mannosyltransferase
LKTTFVIPTYNEAENIPKLVAAVLELPVAVNLLIVDDNSPDGSGDLAEQMKSNHPERIQVMHRKGKLGLGSAYIQGFHQAIKEGADFIGQMDADFSHPIDKIPVLMETLESCDFVIGSRYVSGGKLDENWPFWRKWLSGFGNFYARTLLGLKIRDVTGGYRLWKKETLNAMPLERVKSNGYIFQVEMSYVATLLDFTCKETPIYFADRRWGQSKMSLRIQLEAAYRTWFLLGHYADLKKKSKF